MTAPLKTADTPAGVAKFLVGLAVAVVVAGVTAIAAPVTIASVLQAVVVGLGAALVYPAPQGYSWWTSWKARITTGIAILSALVPFFVQYADTNTWQNLTAVQWLVVALAVLKAVGVYTIPNALAELPVKADDGTFVPLAQDR